jgi:excisionase family DNA binding protein
VATKSKKRRSDDNGKVPPQPEQPLRDDMILTFAEAAGYWRATPRQIERWVHSGKLRGTTTPAGRGMRVRGLDLRLAMEAGRQDRRPEPPSRPKVRTTHVKRTGR